MDFCNWKYAVNATDIRLPWRWN